MTKRITRKTSTGEDAEAPPEKKHQKKLIPVAGFDNRWKFKLDPQPPDFPFMDHYFELRIYLVDQENKLQTGFMVPLVLQLMVEGESTPMGGSSSSSSLVSIDPSTPATIDPNTGIANVRVKVCELSMNRQNRKFCFIVKRAEGPREKFDLPREINPVLSHSFSVVNAQLKVIHTEAWEETWYKDQGGRDKTIDIDVQLYGPFGLLKGVEVPLRCVLLYEDGKMVLNQDLLVVTDTSGVKIDPNSGKAVIRIRIDDVSKNHQSKRFKVRVEANTSETPAHSDKSPDYSKPVTIRSKLNRRQKAKLEQSAEKPAIENGPSPFHNLPPEVALSSWCSDAMNTIRSMQIMLNDMASKYEAISHHVHKQHSISLNRESSSGNYFEGNPLRSFSLARDISFPNMHGTGGIWDIGTGNLPLPHLERDVSSLWLTRAITNAHQDASSSVVLTTIYDIGGLKGLPVFDNNKLFTGLYFDQDNLVVFTSNQDLHPALSMQQQNELNNMLKLAIESSSLIKFQSIDEGLAVASKILSKK